MHIVRQKKIFHGNLALFLLVWLGITGYTLLAILRQSLRYDQLMFWGFLVVLDVLALPLLVLWYREGAKTIRHKASVLVMAVLFVFYWGFATIHSFLSLHTNTLQLRWLAFAYIWEVVLVGAMVTYFVVLSLRFIDRFVSHASTVSNPAVLHARIALAPLRASTIYVLVVVFGYAIGSFQLLYFAEFPMTEIVKNIMNGTVAAILSSFVVFFFLERIVSPALEQSGKLLATESILRHRRISLFKKIYATSGALALVGVGFFGTTAYGRSQVVLEEALKRQIWQSLIISKANFVQSGDLGDRNFEKALYGDSGGVFLLTRPTEIETFHIPESLEYLMGSRAFDMGAAERITVDRRGVTKVIGVLPVDGLHALAAVMFVGDYDAELTRLILYYIWVFVMLVAVVAIVGTLFARSITGPIRQIQVGAVRMGKGDFSVPMTVYTNDELEDLSTALNETSHQLKQSYGRLEDEVAARTEEIIKINKEQEGQIRELDEASKRLVRRDFELQKANEKLREMDEAKSQFVSIAAHQLRTPLSAIKWTLSMLSNNDFGALNNDQRLASGRALESVERMVVLVGDLLNVARIEAGQLFYKFEPVDIESVVEAITQEITAKGREKNLDIVFTRSRKKLPPVWADREKIALAIQSIAENAVRYTPSGGKIRIKVAPHGTAECEIIVADNGIGIPDHQQALLFQKFFRANNAHTQAQEGTGLGLYIAMRIVQAHSGTILVESKEKKGSIFTVVLPFLVADKKA